MEIEVKNISGLRGTFNYSFDEGLSMLHAPNGSGKSSLLKALHLVVSNAKLPQDILNNYLTEKEINGYVKLNLFNKEYEIQIQRKGDKVVITYSNVEDDIFKFPSDVLSYVRAKSYLFQGIINDDESSITSWFHQVTEVHKYELFLEIATRILSELKTKKDNLRKKVSKDVSRNRDQINKLTVEAKELSNEIDSILNSESYQLFMKEHSEKKDQIDKIRKSIKNLNNRKTTLSDEIFKDEESVGSLKKHLEDIKKQIQIYDDNLPIKQEKLRKNEKKRDELEEDLDKIKKNRLEIQEKLNLERKQLKDNEDLINRETCPKCHQRLDPILIKDFVAKGRSQVKKLETKIKEFKTNEREISNEISNIEDELIELTNFLKINREKLNKEKLNKENDFSKRKNGLPDKKKRKKALVSEIELKNKELLGIQQSLAEENPQQNEVFKLQGELNSKSQLITKLEEDLELSSEYQLEYIKAEGYVKRAEEVHDNYSEKFKHLSTETFKRINGALMESFELLELAKFKKIIFEEKDNKVILEIQRDNDVYTSLEKLSGAEKSLITLIITWVVKQMVIPDEPIFLIDEVTTEMDDTRFQDILNYISEKTNYVIVARHKPYKGKKEILSQAHIISTFA